MLRRPLHRSNIHWGVHCELWGRVSGQSLTKFLSSRGLCLCILSSVAHWRSTQVTALKFYHVFFSKIITYILMKGSLSYSSTLLSHRTLFFAYLWFCWAKADRNLQMNKGKEDADFWKDCHMMSFVMIICCLFCPHSLNLPEGNIPQSSSRESSSPSLSMLLLELMMFLAPWEGVWCRPFHGKHHIPLGHNDKSGSGYEFKLLGKKGVLFCLGFQPGRV